MATPEHLDEWVNRQLAVSDDRTESRDATGAWHEFNRRIAGPAPRLRILLWAVVSTAAVGAVVFAVPESRAVAQGLWDRFALNGIQVLITDSSEDAGGGIVGAFSPEVQHSPDVRPAGSLEDATDLARFTPRLPTSDVLAGSPVYSVVDPQIARLGLHTRTIRAVVARIGMSPREVPASWDGASLEVRIGRVLVADFGGVLLLQSLPFQLITPADFDLQRFYRLAFRSVGISDAEARSLGADLALSPALLTFMPKEDVPLLHEFSTARGTGLMIDEVYGRGKTTALWTGSDRVYALHGDTVTLTKSFVTQVAHALE